MKKNPIMKYTDDGDLVFRNKETGEEVLAMFVHGIREHPGFPKEDQFVYGRDTNVKIRTTEDKMAELGISVGKYVVYERKKSGVVMTLEAVVPIKFEEEYIVDGASVSDWGCHGGAYAILEERLEQIKKHGRTLGRDVRENKEGELARAAKLLISGEDYPPSYTWDNEIWRRMYQKSYVDRLKIAGALIAAEIDRVNHLNKSK